MYTHITYHYISTESTTHPCHFWRNNLGSMPLRADVQKMLIERLDRSYRFIKDEVILSYSGLQIPGTQTTSIVKGQPHKRRPFTIQIVKGAILILDLFCLFLDFALNKQNRIYCPINVCHITLPIIWTYPPTQDSNGTHEGLVRDFFEPQKYNKSWR